MYLHAPAALVEELDPAQAERQLGPGSNSHYP
jgi:hypothetical protein